VTAHILSNVRIFTGGCDLTGQSNKIELAAEVEERDVTNFGSVGSDGTVWKEVMCGIAAAQVAAGGQWEAGDTSKVDDDRWAALGGAGPWTIFPHSLTGAVGALAWTTQMLGAQYALLGGVGDVAPWTASGKSSAPLIRGIGLHPPGTARTATGDGTAVEHVAVADGQRLWAALHVLSAAGDTPSLTVAIESDEDDDFDGSETTQITFDAATARSGQWRSAAGPITDTYYRATWTISGSDPSFLFVVALGVF
jgi:hypothetical protein